MVTNNGGEGRSRNTRNSSESRDKGGKRFQNGERRDYNKSNDGEGGNRNGGRQGQRSSGTYNRNNDSKPGNKFGGNGGNKFAKKNYNDRNRVNPYDKDSDEDSRPQRRQPANKENKVKEQQPGKIEIINRIEKEKKAMQKKQAERKNSKATRMQTRPKRTNNIDWTREYENGSYDDDDLDMYL